MKPRTRPLLLLAVGLLVLSLTVVFAAACGTSKDETTTSAAPVTTAAPTEATTAPASMTTGGTIAVKGMVDNPKTLTLVDLQAMKMTTITAEHPKKGSTEYTGVLMSDIMALAGVQSGAAVLNMAATDGYMGQVTLAEMDPDSMVAFTDDGKLNAIMPGQSGKAWVSDLVSLDFE